MRHSTRLARALLLRWSRAFQWASLALVLGRAPAAAQAVELRWNAPAECPGRAQAEARLAELLGPKREALAGANVRANVEIARGAARYRLRLRVSTAARSSARELHAKHCEELVEVSAWLIALAIDPNLPTQPALVEAAPASGAGTAAGVDAATGTAAQAGPGAQAAEGGPKAAAERSVTAQVAPAAATTATPAAATAATESAAARDQAPARPKPVRRRVPLGLVAGGAAGIFAGGGADVQGALGVFAGLDAAWSHTQARVSVHLPRRVEIDDNASAQLWALALSLSECALLGRTVRAGPCLLATGLRTQVTAHGVSGAAPDSVWWATAGAGMQLFWRVRAQLVLTLAAQLGIPISPRPRFTVDPLGPVISAAAWSADAQLGLAFAYP